MTTDCDYDFLDSDLGKEVHSALSQQAIMAQSTRTDKEEEIKNKDDIIENKLKRVNLHNM